MNKYRFLFKNSSLYYNKDSDYLLCREVFFLINLINFIFLFNNSFLVIKKKKFNKFKIFQFSCLKIFFSNFKKNNSFFYKFSFFFFFIKLFKILKIKKK